MLNQQPNPLAGLARPHRWMAAALTVWLLFTIGNTWAQSPDSLPSDTTSTPTTTTPESPPDPAPTGEPSAESQVKDPATYYGLWTLAPAVIAIVLAIVLRQAVPAMFIGVLLGAYMLIPCREAASRLSDSSVLEGVRLSIEHFLIGGISDPTRMQVILFTLLIGAAVGVMTASGGTGAMVNAVAKFASTPRRGQLTTWLAGMVVFFDDYANSMIVGPTMRPVCDRLKISRAKLAYIVDSTAAPISSIALVGTWLGTELAYIKTGLESVAQNGTPDFLTDVNDMNVFLSSIPYRYYPIFALWMVICIALTGRDFGPMRRAEAKALTENLADSDLTPSATDGATTRQPSALLAVAPILVLVGVTVAILYLTGRAAMDPADEFTFQNILKNANSYLAILYGALASLTVAVVMALGARTCTIGAAFDGMLDGMTKMFPAVVILALAWALSQVSQDLKLGAVLRTALVGTKFEPSWLPVQVWLPLSIFICAAGVSFATGTSWATMAILTPTVVETAAGMGAGLPHEQALPFFYAAVGSVLAGAIFGDHCSPISDTTVLSAVASSCRIEEHVWTQMPYAVVVALISMGVGNIYCMYQNKPAWMGLLIGAAALLVVVFVIGRRPKPPSAPRVTPPGPAPILPTPGQHAPPTA